MLPHTAADSDQKAEYSGQQGNKKPTYRDFFMAMAFLANARSKDKKYQVLHYNIGYLYIVQFRMLHSLTGAVFRLEHVLLHHHHIVW